MSKIATLGGGEFTRGEVTKEYYYNKEIIKLQ